MRNTIRRISTIGIAIAGVIGSTAVAAEHDPSTSHNTIEFEGRQWRRDVSDHVDVHEYGGKTALHVRGARMTASAYLPEVEFQDGTIEVDIATPGRSAPGIGFRGLDNGRWRNKAVFNYWVGMDEDESEVLEQAVITRRAGTVLLLNIRKPNQDGVGERLEPRDWFHVKLVVQGDTVTVFLNGSEEPSIEMGAVFDAKQKGMLGLCGGDCYFANFQFTSAR